MWSALKTLYENRTIVQKGIIKEISERDEVGYEGRVFVKNNCNESKYTTELQHITYIMSKIYYAITNIICICNNVYKTIHIYIYQLLNSFNSLL